MCYLPEFENRSKGSKTFYQDNNYLEKANTTIDIIESKYSFTEQTDLEFMNIDYRQEDFDVLKDYYFEFIKRRNNILKEKFLTSLELEEIENDEYTDEQIEVEQYSERFFRTTKVGKLVQRCFNDLINKNKLSDADIFDLQNLEYSRKNLGCAYPVLVPVSIISNIAFEARRYYSATLTINNVEFYLCKEWYESDRAKVVPWVKKRL